MPGLKELLAKAASERAESTERVRGAKQIIRLPDGVRGFKAAPPTDEELDLINSKYAIEALTAEEIWVRDLWIAHNQIDRDRERFHEDLLKDFAETLPGRNMMWPAFGSASHTWSQPGEGTIFKAWTEDVGGWLWARAKFYHLRKGNEGVSERFDAGIWRFASIGFSASERVGIYDKEGTRLFTELRAPGEGLEASIVGVEAQQGAGVKTIAQLGDDVIITAKDGAPVELHEDGGVITISRKEAADDATHHDQKDTSRQPKPGRMKMKYQTLEGKTLDVTVGEEAVHDFVKDCQDIATTLDAHKKLSEAVEGMCKDAELEGIDITGLRTIITEGAAAQKALEVYKKAEIDQAIKRASLAGTIDGKNAEAVAAETKHLQTLDIERVKMESRRHLEALKRINPKAATEEGLIESDTKSDPQGGGEISEEDSEARAERMADDAKKMRGDEETKDEK